MDLKRKIQHSDVRIYDYDYDLRTDARKAGYNIGDLLHMPRLADCETFNQNERHQIVNDIYKDSIFNYYYSSRPKDEEIPNIPRLNNAVKQWRDKNEDNFKTISRIVSNKNCLCVHVRSGDLDVDRDFINKIRDMSKKFNMVVILSGVHCDQSFRDDANKMNAFVHQMNLITAENNNIYIYLERPDIHLSLMQCAANLMVHRGGFSALATCISTGKLYTTKFFYHVEYPNWKKLVNKEYTLV